MADVEVLLNEIELKSRKLTAAHALLMKENHQMAEEIETLKKNIAELTNKNEELKNNNTIQHITGVVSGKKNDTKEARKKINEFVREIDKCISLLNQ